MAFAREEIDPEALRILDDAGFVWDPNLLAFTREKSTAPELETIHYEFLREQQLVVGSALDRSARTGQLLRLRILVQSLN